MGEFLNMVKKTLTLFLNEFKQVKYRQAQCVGNNLHRIQHQIWLPVFKTTEIGLIETTFPQTQLGSTPLTTPAKTLTRMSPKRLNFKAIIKKGS